MTAYLSPERLAGASARHPWRVIALWALFLGAALTLASGIGDVLTDEIELTTSTESGTADDLLADRFVTSSDLQIPPGVPFNPDGDLENQESVIIETEAGADDTTGAAADGAELDRLVAEAVTELRSRGDIALVSSHLDGQPWLLSDDGRTALVTVVGDGLTTRSIVESLDGSWAGFRVTTVGEESVTPEFDHLVEETLVRGEGYGIVLALVVLLVVFGAAVAAGVPIVLAVASIIVAVGLTALVGQAFELSNFVINIITMIGLAVGIDYSLFIVQRYREERDRGRDKVAAIELAGGSASRAVLFSGVAVIIALSGMFMIPTTIFKSFGAGSILVVLSAIAASLTLLPAVISVLGDRLNWLRVPLLRRRRDPEQAGGLWDAVAAVVTRRAVLAVTVVSGALLVLAGFYLQINLGTSGISSLPPDSEGRHAFEVLNREFVNNTNEATIVIDTPDVGAPAVQAAVAELGEALAADDRFGAPVFVASDTGDLGRITVAMQGDFSSSLSREALDDLRSRYLPAAFDGVADVHVTGGAALDVDYVEVIGRYTPWVFAYVLTFSFLLLMVSFRSIVVPIKAVVMNLLSVGASYGILVLVFQRGIGADLFGFQQAEVIEPWLPLFLFTILFGLSMDYHVFLLSRIKERYDQTGDNHAAVAFGLRSTGSLITGAALIMVAVFGGFASGDLLTFQQMGFGLAVAVVLDATVIRSILVPASMELLGARNWYFPRWLEWIPEIHIEGHPDHGPGPASGPGAEVDLRTDPGAPAPLPGRPAAASVGR